MSRNNEGHLKTTLRVFFFDTGRMGFVGESGGKAKLALLA